jgi:hypothetical protein
LVALRQEPCSRDMKLLLIVMAGSYGQSNKLESSREV